MWLSPPTSKLLLTLFRSTNNSLLLPPILYDSLLSVKVQFTSLLPKSPPASGLTQVPQGNIKLINISYDHEVHCGTAGIVGLTVTGWCLLGLLQGPMERTPRNCPAIGWRGAKLALTPSRPSLPNCYWAELLKKAMLRTLLRLPVHTQCSGEKARWVCAEETWEGKGGNLATTLERRNSA